MPRLLIDKGDWVVVCDGAKALVLENIGDEKFLTLKTIEVFEQKDLPTHELGSDVPGRAFSSVGHLRSAVGQSDWHDQRERQFLTDLAQHLDAAITAGRTKSVIMVAPPRALGMLRPVYSNVLKSAVRAELDKDLVKHPMLEIEKHLAAV